MHSSGTRIFFFCRCRARSKLWRSLIYWLRLSIPTHENKVKQNLRCLPSNNQAATNTNKQQKQKPNSPTKKQTRNDTMHQRDTKLFCSVLAGELNLKYHTTTRLTWVHLAPISLRVAQGWPGWARIHATSNGTMHHRDQREIVLSPQPQAAHTVPLAGNNSVQPSAGSRRSLGNNARECLRQTKCCLNLGCSNVRMCCRLADLPEVSLRQFPGRNASWYPMSAI